MQHLFFTVLLLWLLWNAVKTHAYFTAENYVVMTTEYLPTLYIAIYLYFFKQLKNVLLPWYFVQSYHLCLKCSADIVHAKKKKENWLIVKVVYQLLQLGLEYLQECKRYPKLLL